MEKTLIIGIGNTLRGDDGLGWAIVDELMVDAEQSDLELITVQQLGLDLVEQVGSADRVAFIDARLGSPIGQIYVEEIAANSRTDGSLTHFFDPGTLLAAVYALYQRHPHAWLFSITSDQYEYAESLTPSAQAAVSEVTSLIRQWLAAGSLPQIMPRSTAPGDKTVLGC